MPFALLIIGIALLVSAVRGTQGDLFNLVKGDFTGPNNFIYWTIAILFIGSVGYIPKLKPLSVGFLTLVVLVLVLKRGDPNSGSGGFFAEFTNALKTTQVAATPAPATTPATSSTPNSSIITNLFDSLSTSFLQ